jgi:hypothetical protein
MRVREKTLAETDCAIERERERGNGEGKARSWGHYHKQPRAQGG